MVFDLTHHRHTPKIRNALFLRFLYQMSGIKILCYARSHIIQDVVKCRAPRLGDY